MAILAWRRFGIQPGETCVVLGLGPIEHSAVQVLRALGIDSVVGIDASALRRERALLARAVATVSSEGILETVRRVAGPGPRGHGAGADAVLDASVD